MYFLLQINTEPENCPFVEYSPFWGTFSTNPNWREVDFVHPRIPPI